MGVGQIAICHTDGRTPISGFQYTLPQEDGGLVSGTRSSRELHLQRLAEADDGSSNTARGGLWTLFTQREFGTLTVTLRGAAMTSVTCMLAKNCLQSYENLA